MVADSIMAGSVSGGLGNAEIATDFLREVVVDLIVPRHRRPRTGLWVVPPRVVRSFAQEPAPVLRQMTQEVDPLHTAIGSSS
jgi:hypothetical protein